MRRVGRRTGVVGGVVLVSLLLATTAAPAQVPDAGDAVRSVVVLGDSVAAGEGATAGYEYRDRILFPAWARRTSVPRASASRCGRTDAAYGALVARALGAEVTNLACSGASFDRGMTLDDRFDRARPDLVLVTAGANSVAFERAFAYCVLASRGLVAREAERIATSRTVPDAVSTSIDVALRRIFGTASPTGPQTCTPEAPGAYLERTVLDRAETVGAAARDLAARIRARGRSLGRVPEVVFTTYPDPLPLSATALAQCPDAAGLGPAQVVFLHQTIHRLNGVVRDALADAPGVTVVDPGPAFAGHRWCDPDPWTYGPSIYASDPASRVPFHPTPAGQQAIADAVLSARRGGPSDRNGLV